MVKYLSLVIIIAALLLSGCGKTPMEAGDSAFDNQNYAEALKYYLEAFKEEPNNPTLKEKIALCYFKEGEKIYLRTRVIKAFEARIRSGVLNLPEYPSENLKKTVSEMHFLLGLAYTAAKADNPYQEKKYFNNAIQNLEIALKYDSTNTEAQEAFARLKDENFTEIYEKGVAAYNKGKSDDLQYIAADYYLSNALKLDPDHEKAAKYLSLARKRSLNLLDPGMDVPIAITDRMQNPEYTAFLIVAYNQMPENLYVSANSFVLVKKGGEEFYGKTSNMFTTPLEGTTLSNGEEISGVVAFPTTGDISLARVELRKDGEVLGYKNLP
jgi:tetratricopeptide (TPR) repeat protein